MRSASTSVFKKALQSLKPKMTGAYAFFPMPQISPTMGSGQILRWHVAKGDCTQSNDLLVDVKVDKLVQVEDKENFEMLEAEMEIEVIESMYVAKLLRPVGETIQCGEPIAILCDEEDDIPALSALEVRSVNDRH
jgi:pyruvate/2-oxoglutarate dehydrogenase complex dihydrolipoamide acyltransferase (E2) component